MKEETANREITGGIGALATLSSFACTDRKDDDGSKPGLTGI
jgi:hypothetical protein